MNLSKLIKKCSAPALMCCTLLLSSNAAYAFPVDFSDAPIVDAVRALGVMGGRDVVVAGDIKGTLTIHIEDTDFDTALRAIATAYNLSYKHQDGMVIVSDQKQLNTMEMFSLKHLDPELFKKHLEPILANNDDAVVNSDLHAISVMGSQPTLAKVRELVDKYDVAQNQVNIQATVIELSKGKARSIGLNYGDNGWARDTRISLRGDSSAGFSFSIGAKHEETLSSGKVLARPNITTFDGRKAKILMGDQVPVFTSTGSGTDSNANVNVEYKDVGVNLEVLPRINDIEKGVITLTIKPTVSTITEWIESGNNKAPQISSRVAETIVRVKAGETILIGGLLKHDEIKNIKSMLPFFSKIPVLGEIFKTRSIEKSDTELVIAITPVIIPDKDGVPQVGFQQLTPNLHNELMGMQSEPKDYNLTPEQQAEYERQIKELDNKNQALDKAMAANNKEYEKKMAEIKSKMEAKDSEITKLKETCRKLTKELEANNNAIINALNGIKKRSSIE